MNTDARLGDGVPPPAPAARVYIVVLNWNGWRHTIECLESVFRIDYPAYRVLVCDNASSDDSWNQIRRWARGEIEAENKNPALAALTSPPIPKPIPFTELGPTEARRGGGTADARLVLIQTGANGGFAAGNNLALTYALKRGDFDFAWLLNNDTVVRPDALSQLVQRMQERPDAGICGSTLLYYDDPSKVQAWGGSVYNKWFARGGCIGSLADAAQPPKAGEIDRKMAYVVGASMLVARSFLEQVGLMNEQYFLYFDELDWATRAKGRFQLTYSPGSVVYHREGGAIGSHRVHMSEVAEFWLVRNRILFTRIHHPLALPSVLAAVGLSAVHRLLNFHWGNLKAVIRGFFQGLNASKTAREQP